MKKLFFYFSLILVIACDNSDDSNNKNTTTQDEWTVSSQYLKEGSPFKLMSTQDFKTVQEINSLSDDSKVALVSFNDEVRVYSYRYTNEFEIINDTFYGHYISISYCPITQSAICFNREINVKFII